MARNVCGAFQKGTCSHHSGARCLRIGAESLVETSRSLGVDVEELAGPKAPSGPRRHPGPRSQLDERVEKIRQLPKKKQALLLEVIDALLEKHA